MNRSAFAILVVCLSVALTATGVLMWRRSAHGLPAEAVEMLRLVHRQVLEQHVEEQDAEELLYDAIEGMVQKLDRHSRFVRPQEVKGFVETEITGTYEGIGIVMVPDRNPITVEFPLPGGPAENAGLTVGDQIVGVDGDDVAAIDRAETRSKILGAAGTVVELLVARDGEEPFTRELERAAVRQPAAKWAQLLDRERRLGYVYIGDFQEGVVAQFDERVDELEAVAGGPLRGLIVDLRFNPGGLLTEAVALANRFIAGGTIVALKRRGDQVIQRHDAESEACTMPDTSLVVLINGQSASASEVVAGALQDYDRATLVGERSFGKGVVQSIYRWGDMDFRLKLTTSHYYTPDGRNIERTMRRADDIDAVGGIAPEVTVALVEERARALQRLLREVYEVPRRYRAAVDELAKKLDFEVDRPPNPNTDPQLAAALEQLDKKLETAPVGTGR